MNKEGSTPEKNNHYSEQAGHAARSEYHKALQSLGQSAGIKPWVASESWRRRRQGMRRITDAGKE